MPGPAATNAPREAPALRHGNDPTSVQHPTDHIFHHTPGSLADWFAARDMPRYRAAQVLDWVYRKGVADPGAMTNLARRERETLASEMAFLSGETIAEQHASDGTRKLLVEWNDRATKQLSDPGEPTDGRLSLAVLGESGCSGDDPSRQTECVMIPARSTDAAGEKAKLRRTACVSSQVGCPVGCRFCASGLGGLDGNLSAGRIVEQIWRLNDLMLREHDQDQPSPSAEAPPRITNVVFMGMGEPLANFANVVHAVRTMAADWGFAIGARRITISTVGLPAAIERLADQLELPVTLALSLHAPNDDLRRELIPWAEHATIDDLFRACRKWFEKTGREITLEYTLLHNVNDRPEHAAQLAGVAKRLRANVNLIRFNEVEGVPYRRPQDHDVREFQHILRARNVNVHIRASRGRDIAAACGQLRHEKAGAP